MRFNSCMIEKISDFVKKNYLFILLFVFFGVLYAQDLTTYKMFMWDEAEYASLARSVIGGEGYTVNGGNEVGRLPFYPLSIAGSFLVFGVSYESTKIPGIFFALLLLIAIYYFVGKYTDKPTALVSAFLLGSIPLFWSKALNTLTDVTFSGLFFAAAMFFYAGINKDIKYLYGGAVFLGASFLTRYNVVLLIPAIGIYLLYRGLSNKKKTRGILEAMLKSKHAYLAFFIFLVISIPWLLYLQSETGNIFYGFEDAQNRIASYGVSSSPWYYYAAVLPSLLNGATFLLLVLGMGYTLYKKQDFGIYIISIILTGILYFSQFSWKGERMMVFLLPFLVILSGIGLVKVVYPWLTRDLSVGICAVILIFSFYLNYNHVQPILKHSTAIGYPSMIQASSYVKSNTAANQAIIGASTPQYYWYAERVTYGYPKEEQELFNFLSETEVSYLLLNNYERNQPAYVMQLFAKGFFTDEGTLMHPEDAQELKIFGDLSKFNDPMMNPVTIVVPSVLFVERTQYLLNDTI